ncbi:beta-galactosidase/beta-glucuronidase [Povalibacter uvarum]|uniref:Beta-galactosidase/beta-glucuronidase n=1 Tax=Povalibacter uvarum TaxID=732238 RepID=A0A841HJ74_9GAMM|nr:LamG-like jellyroll fold domain-containing protein [Povalibacter uvarum]MBB6092439.1 beta-galactosidase/beta-glucuronidase [Povalibacter uvarum]
MIGTHNRVLGQIVLACSLWLALPVHAQIGPYHARFLEGGEGIRDAVDARNPVLTSQASWTIHAWVRSDHQDGPVLIGGLGEPTQDSGRYLGLRDGKPFLRLAGQEIAGAAAISAGEWHLIAATFDGSRAQLFVDGSAASSTQKAIPAAGPFVEVAPTNSPWPRSRHFGGEIAAYTVQSRALAAVEIQALFKARPAFERINFADISVGWPWQVKQLTGLSSPQLAWTLPISKAAFPKTLAAVDSPTPALKQLTENTWSVGDWRLVEAPRVQAQPGVISSAGLDVSAWHPATVPGTVLTTLVNRGVYPDPDYGLNNMAIPETLARQDYWYRTEFAAPVDGRRFTLTFNGINYRAEVWLNGAPLGAITGAFVRGVFDVTEKVRSDAVNVLAVRVSPPPHPGIPHEQSIKAGPGENGGAMALDGPTFIATEGWDWIPGIRDRNTGLWQDVVLSVTGSVRIKDPQVVTQLPLPDTSRASVVIRVPLQNLSSAPVSGTLTASFDHVRISKPVSLTPGENSITLSPQEFTELNLSQPRLWWPNGYGKQELYRLQLAFDEGTTRSDSRALRFGVRQITYELSLFDEKGRLRRVDVDTALGSSRGERLIDVRHEALKKSPKGWAASLYPRALESPAVKEIDDDALTPHLALKVNGVRIAARGGNWGMDDSRKRISRDRLEPYFRLHREANLNTIRNWVGLNYEDAFFDLADEYGLLVLSDFWASTQDFQVEPQDPALFLKNARDTILRYRNHPSIALWFGRNEGVPQPILNEGLADLVAEVDGTRHFTGSSNRVNLQGSGPYNYRPPAQYFTELAEGFSVEVGTPSLSTLESIRAWAPPEDQWPISDAFAYHDWHHGGNGDVATFMKTLEERFGAPTSLEDFERKAQMMNYETHRAMFEGFHAHLWTKNSGRLLWMTHPAWPSHAWQIYSSDYDTHASYYGVRKACEPIHAQMNLPDYSLSVVNSTRNAARRLSLRVRVLSLDNRLLEERREKVDAAANAATALKPLALSSHLEREDVVLVKLELTDEDGRLVSENFYWQARDASAHRKLAAMPSQSLSAQAASEEAGGETRIRVRIEHKGTAPALAIKLTLLDAEGERILPAYYADNYVSLLPGESREIVIAYPAQTVAGSTVALRGWNLATASVAVSGP